jgi:hypothetical protein
MTGKTARLPSSPILFFMCDALSALHTKQWPRANLPMRVIRFKRRAMPSGGYLKEALGVARLQLQH